MKPKNSEALVIGAGLIFVWCLVTIARSLLLPLLCLILVLLGWRPASSHTPRRIESEAPVAPLPPASPALITAPQRPVLADLKVADLRRMARMAGHRALARSGRKADLLAILALTP